MDQVCYDVDYQVATYSGTIAVWVDPDADLETVKAVARQKLMRRSGPWPIGYESFKPRLVGS